MVKIVIFGRFYYENRDFGGFLGGFYYENRVFPPLFVAFFMAFGAFIDCFF
jgi:hypothetical protein